VKKIFLFEIKKWRILLDNWTTARFRTNGVFFGRRFRNNGVSLCCYFTLAIFIVMKQEWTCKLS